MIDRAVGQGETGPRLHELRVVRVADARLRYRVARWLSQRFPEHEFRTIVTALGGAGFVIRVRLGEGEEPALLRELYEAGVPPASVILLPVGLIVSPRKEEDGSDHRFAVFTRRGGRFSPTWNSRAFLFGPLWYLRNGLYAKGLILLVLGVLPIWTLGTGLLVSFLTLVYCGVVGNWDHYLLRVHRTQWW